MRFTVPQFIEHEAKIIGPLNFKQFVYIGLAGAICFIIYFSAPFSLFLISCFIFGGGALAFAFLKIGGQPFSTIIANFLKFNLTPKIYIWHKKETQVAVFKKEIQKNLGEKEEELPLKIAEKSRLKKLRTQIETKTK